MAPILGIMASQISGHLWAPSGAYDSIATTTVGAGGSSSITFSSIPSGYTHLQLRSFYNFNSVSNLRIQLNGATSSSQFHYIYGDGSSVLAGTSTSDIASIQFGSSTPFYVQVLDILDYGSTSKNKTLRELGGVDYNGSGGAYLSSNLYQTTSAISSFTITSNNSATFAQYSSFALYGIKGN